MVGHICFMYLEELKQIIYRCLTNTNLLDANYNDIKMPG